MLDVCIVFNVIMLAIVYGVSGHKVINYEYNGGLAEEGSMRSVLYGSGDYERGLMLS